MIEEILIVELKMFLFHGCIPMVLYGIVSPALQLLCDVSPSVAIYLVKQEQHPFFPCGPLVFIDVRVQMIMPAFSALLSNASCIKNVLTSHLLSYGRPLLRAILAYESHKVSIFFGSPGLFGP